jgi:hypothetical protein
LPVTEKDIRAREYLSERRSKKSMDENILDSLRLSTERSARIHKRNLPQMTTSVKREDNGG